MPRARARVKPEERPTSQKGRRRLASGLNPPGRARFDSTRRARMRRPFSRLSLPFVDSERVRSAGLVGRPIGCRHEINMFTQIAFAARAPISIALAAVSVVKKKTITALHQRQRRQSRSSSFTIHESTNGSHNSVCFVI